MKTNIKWLLAAGAMVSALALPAAAQPAGCPGGPGAEWGMGGRAMRDPAKMQAFAAQRLDALGGTLKLSAAQQPAWQQYRTRMLADLEEMAKQRPEPGTMRDAPATARMEMMLAQSKLHQAHLEKRLAETRRFYDQLTDEQKKVFDAESLPKRGRRGGGGAGPAQF